MSKRSDIPFSTDSSRLFLPWISMLMVFITVLITAGAMVVHTSLTSWNKSLSGSMTLQIPTFDEKGKPRGDIVRTDIETALTILRSSDGILGASVLSDEQMRVLMTPWIGEEAAIEDLPLPKLIDVNVDTERRLDLDQIRADLKEQVPAAVLDSHRLWLENLITLGLGVIRLISFIVFLLLLTTSFTVIYSTRTSLMVHRPVIALVHMMGANDFYVAIQYALRSFKLTLTGGILGILLAVPIMIGVHYFVQNLAYDFLVRFSLLPWQWYCLAMIPVLIAGLSFVTTFKTVIHYLKQFL